MLMLAWVVVPFHSANPSPPIREAGHQSWAHTPHCLGGLSPSPPEAPCPLWPQGPLGSQFSDPHPQADPQADCCPDPTTGILDAASPAGGPGNAGSEAEFNSGGERGPL